MMGIEMAHETLDYMTRLVGPEDFIKFSRHESFKSYFFHLNFRMILDTVNESCDL
jgi:hypothetical protein